MMKRSLVVLTVLLAGFYSVCSANAGDRQLAEDLYVKSGLEKQMQDIGPALLAGYKNNYRKMASHTARDEEINSRIEGIIEVSFDLQDMRETVVAGLAHELETSDLETVLTWLDSPLGKKVTALEEEASSEEGIRGVKDFVKSLTNSSVSQERVRSIRKLDEGMHVTETAVEITLSTQFAFSMTTGEAKKTLSRDDIRELYKDFQKHRSSLESILQSQIYASLLYTYQKLTDAELGEYVGFAKSQNGKEYSRVTSMYLTRAVTASCLAFAREVTRL